MIKRLILVVFLVPALAAGQTLSTLGPSRAFPVDAPFSFVYGSPSGRWLAPLDAFFKAAPPPGPGRLSQLPALHALYEADPALHGAMQPALKALEAAGYGAAYFAAQTPERKAALLVGAVKVVQNKAQEEAARLVPASSRAPKEELPLVASGLYMLQTSLALYIEPSQWTAVQEAYQKVDKRLTAPQRASLRASIERLNASWKESKEDRLTVVEAVAAGRPGLPGPQLTPRILEARRAFGPPGGSEAVPAPLAAPAAETRSRTFEAKVALLGARTSVKKALGRPYRALLDAFRSLITWAGELYRKYLSGQEMDAHSFRWHVVEDLHKKGDFRGSFGHAVHEGTPEVMSPLVFPEASVDRLRGQEAVLRSPLSPPGAENKLALSPMISISGMSFPQLSAQSHLSLLYIHLKLAKELGVRQLYNTGEGGPGFLLAMLEGDRESLERRIVEWNLENKQFGRDTWDEAKVVQFVIELMHARDRLLAGFSPEDLRRAQIVAQFGSALNGIRNPDNRVDFDKLRRVGESPFVAMIQYKLKQAAKRGAKVNPSKIDSFVAALREIPRDKPFKSPEVNPDMDSYEGIARLVLATRVVTGKPVSLKFGVGQAADLYEFLKFLRDARALPDHIQLDGRGEGFSPGSGNAPPTGNTSLPLNEAVIVTDAILKKLGVRDRVFLDATGDILLVDEAVEKLALGADGVSAGRLWMGMGLGCAMVRECADGKCPYGIAARSYALVGLAMDPLQVAPRGYKAASNWWKAYTQELAETGASSWLGFRERYGLGSRSAVIRKKAGLKMVTLDQVYNEDYVENLLRGALNPLEVRSLVFGR